MQYLFLLGREPLLSFRELQSVFGSKNAQVFSERIGSVNVDAPDVIQKGFARLGGSIKVAEVISRMPLTRFSGDPVATLSEQSFLQKALGDAQSVAFAISYFGNPKGFPFQQKKLGLSLKKEYRSRFTHVRYVESKEPVTSSVTVQRNKLLRGLDLWVVFQDDMVTLARTVAVQDYETFSQYDYGRPKPDARAGMLPPKLARMMVNVAGESSALLDPFVGSGTVLQEAALLGIKKLYGSDIDPKAIAGTKANMDWIAFQTKSTFDLHLSATPIQKLNPADYEGVDAVVTEIDLGPPLSQKPSPQDAAQYAAEASRLVETLLFFVSRVSSVKTCVVALPFWPSTEKTVFADLVLPKGFTIRPTPEMKSIFKQEANHRSGMLYIRERQRVGREILVIEK